MSWIQGPLLDNQMVISTFLHPRVIITTFSVDAVSPFVVGFDIFLLKYKLWRGGIGVTRRVSFRNFKLPQHDLYFLNRYLFACVYSKQFEIGKLSIK